ncbi:MAG: glycosyltransferase family 2 protein [Opitutae bacterium]|nr:glycosyltransferase family 2 protein [Opitutae bacterium]
MQLSIIIPLYGGLSFTQAMVASLQATLPPGLTHEIILVDDGSTDGTRAWLATLTAAPFRVILNDRNLGYAAANNRGAAQAGGELLALLNNDLILTPGWLEPMLATFAQLGRRAGIVGNCQYRVTDNALDHAGITVTSRAKLEHIRALPATPPDTGYCEVFAVTAACCLVRRSDFLAVGGFDEGFANGGEDVDLALKLRRRGQHAFVALNSAVRHHVSAARGPTSQRDERNSRRLFQRWPAELEQAIAEAAQRDVPPPARPSRRRARLLARGALFREECRWAELLDGAVSPLRTAPAGAVSVCGFSHAPAAETAWLYYHAVIQLPVGTPCRNFFLNGHLEPAPADHPAATGSLGLRLMINGVQSVEIFPLSEGNFNFGLDAPALLPGQPTRIVVRLLGADGHNARSRLARMISVLPLPRPWRAWVQAYTPRYLNRRLRFSQIVADDTVVYDFRHHPPLMRL